MSLNVLTQGGGANGESASIFVYGLSESDIVSAKNGTKEISGDWTKKKNPSSVVPDGYTQLECIKSSGTQYINTGVIFSGVARNYEISLDFEFSHEKSAHAYFFACQNPTSPFEYIFFRTYSGGVQWALWGTSQISPALEINTRYRTISRSVIGGSNSLDIDGSQVFNGTSGVTPCSHPLYLMARNLGGTADCFASMSIYACKIIVDDVVVRDYVPAKRNFDGAIGLYDLANGVFYPNSGTGSFAAGAEIKSFIDGHIISGINKYGVWTVTASNGEKTFTQDVMVDAAMTYEIEMGVA